MSTLTIRNKLWISFGLLTVLLVSVGVLTLANLRDNEKQLVGLVTEVQPTVVQSLHLVDQLDRASAALGFYLLSKEDLHKQDYLVYLAKIGESVVALKAMPSVQRDPAVLALVHDAEEKIGKLDSYKSLMLSLAEDRGKNIPAMSFAVAEVNPRVQQLLQSLQEILFSEQDEQATPERKKFALEVATLRHYLVSAVNELRLYLAFRGDEQIQNFKMMRENVDEAAKTLGRYGEDFLTFEQQIAVESFNKSYRDYFKAADRLLEIHKGEDWRQDAYIIRKEIAPLLAQVQSALNGMVSAQQETALAESATLTARVNRTQMIVGALMAAGLLAALIVGYLLSRAINTPIRALEASATELARGRLDHPIDVSRQDELGNLAKRFAAMRDSIRTKINDLHVLNHTGEELAGLHDRVAALRTALRVMGEQTRVEWGSVYLLNDATQMLEIVAYYPERPEQGARRAKSFRLGEGVAGKAAQERRVIFVPDTSATPDFVAASADRAAQAIICVPMVDHDRVFGVMNFSGAVGTVKFEASDAEFAETIARMTVVTSKNIQMLNVIEEQNRTLEHKVEERTAQLRQKTNDINNMLQNMHQGIFTVLPDLTVHPEYSAYLESILETKSIAARDVMELLFASAELSANTLDQVRAALGAIVGEDAMMYDFNRHLLIGEFEKTMGDGRRKILELEWDPIRGEADTVEKIMVTVRDVTDLRRLQAEAKHQKWELEVIGQILALSRPKFQSFIANAYELADQSAKLVDGAPAPDADTVALLFRNMHTIKGNARTYGLHAITEAAHAAESTYDRVRKNPEAPWAPAQARAELATVRTLLETYERIFKTKLAGNEVAGLFLDMELVELGKQALAEIDDNDPASLRRGLDRIQQLIHAIGTERISSVLEDILRSLPELAARLGKDAPRVVVKDNHVRVVPDIAPILKNVFNHEFRNALDHGLESPAERQAEGKPAQGTITVEVVEDREQLELRLYDDGRGLALEKIRARAVEKGLIAADAQPSDEELALLVFESGLSTAEQVSDVSGRGVGMDAVQKFVAGLGGKVRLRLRGQPHGKLRYRAFESCITLPRSAYVKVA